MRTVAEMGAWQGCAIEAIHDRSYSLKQGSISMGLVR